MNPFTPSFGVLPRQFAGRTNILTEIGAALTSEGSDPALTAIFVGPRGCGKTCLLSYFEKESAG